MILCMGTILDMLTGRRGLTAAAAQDSPLLPTSVLNAAELATWDDTGAPLVQLTIEDLFGVELNTKPTRARAMGVGAVAKARQTIAGKIAGFPLVAMHGLNTAPRPPAWVQQPEAGRDRFQTLLWTVDALLFYGRAWWLVSERYAAGGAPRRFEFVPEWNAEIDKAGRLVKANGRDVRDQRDVVRIDGPHEGLLNMDGGRAVRAAIAIDRAAGKAADNPVPSVELHQTGGETLSKAERAELIKGWIDARRGTNGGVAYTNESIEARMHGMLPEQLLISARNIAAVDIARAAGVSAWVVDAAVEGSSMTYNSVPSRSRELVEYGLAPYMDAITGRLSMDDVLPAGSWLKFHTAQLLAGTMSERAAGYKAMIDAGIYTVEQCQALESGVPLESGE